MSVGKRRQPEPFRDATRLLSFDETPFRGRAKSSMSGPTTDFVLQVCDRLPCDLSHLQLDEHGDVKDEGEEGHWNDVEGEVLPAWRRPDVDAVLMRAYNCLERGLC